MVISNREPRLLRGEKPCVNPFVALEGGRKQIKGPCEDHVMTS